MFFIIQLRFSFYLIYNYLSLISCFNQLNYLRKLVKKRMDQSETSIVKLVDHFLVLDPTFNSSRLWSVCEAFKMELKIFDTFNYLLLMQSQSRWTVVYHRRKLFSHTLLRTLFTYFYLTLIPRTVAVIFCFY